ncbi:MAG: BON domain-containing protein [Pseudonocardia sp.]|uniref:BON domain-containing protein n=1 Tax=Pseudonocardia sp. TaxID=60912 RepID=UPI001AC854FD|nr:BON domain-containing protein [Pseudonocardia sp.]MBN9102523.1 BON domain-containing protein [Pseudonocardia sp.]
MSERYDPNAGRDPRREALDTETAVGAALARNHRLHGHSITATAGPEGLLTLTGAVATQALRREVELTCWTLPAVRTLHDELVVGRSAPHVTIRGAAS